MGHDDLYPEMNVINPYLKRECDATAKDSLLWLVENAKKYNTVISYHGNVANADFTKAKVYNITADGNKYICDVTVTDKKISLDIKAGQAVAIKLI